MGYVKSAIKGVSWMSAGRAVNRGLTFIKILVLARVLTPSQFGVFGIASLILAFLETITETGINIVLIQSKNQLSEYLSSAWVVSIIRGILIAILLIVTAPFIALFFHSPSALGVILFISIVPFVRGFINPAEVKFQKDLRFNLQFWFTSALFIVDAFTAVITALITHSVYSLALGMLVSALLEVVLSFILISPRPNFAIDKRYFREIFHRGMWVTAYTIFNYIAENGDNAVVGRVMGATPLGFYQMAFKVSILPITEVSNVVSSVAFPVYTKIADDTRRLREAFLKTLITVFLGALILGTIIFLFPNQIIFILLGDKWLSIAPVLQVLIIYGVLRTISGPASALFLALGKQKYVTAMIFLRFFGLAVTIYPLVHMYGLVGAGYSQLLSVIIETPLLFYFVYRIFRNNK